MQPEIHPAEAAVQPPPSDLLPAQGRKGIPRVTAILGVGLLAGAAFLGGIEAQKQWGGNSSNGGRFGRAFGAGGTGTATGTGGTQGGSAGAGAGGFFGRGGGITTGKVKSVQGSTMLVTTNDGNTVKVSVPASTPITKSVTAKLSGVHPGDAVTAIGTATSDGVVKATSVRLGALGFGGFGGGRRAGGGGFGQNGAGNGGAPSTNGG